MSSFNFLAAINGEPIYCNGVREYPVFNPEINSWDIGDTPRWHKDGSYIFVEDKNSNLTTDPPKKKVKKTVNVFVHRMDSRVLDASFDKKPLLGTDWDILFTHEIEVEE